MKKIGKVNFSGYECDVRVAEYRNGGTAIQLFESEEPFATASSWIPGLNDGEIAIKDYSENEGMLESLIVGNIIQPPHRMLSGFPIVRLR